MKEVVLVTGGSGLVGSALKEVIIESGNAYDQFEFKFLSRKDGDLRNDKTTCKIFDKVKPVHVLHLAARVGGLFANMRANELFYKDNKNINENVLACAFKSQVKKCISCLSTCIFPDKANLPITEDFIHSGRPSETNFGYSMAKRELDLISKKYSNESEGKSLFTSVIPCNIYGKNDNFYLPEAHVVPSLIHQAHTALFKHQETSELSGTDEFLLNVKGSGKPMRQFLYSKDLAKILLYMLQTYHDPSPIILAPSVETEISIAKLAEMIVDTYAKQTGKSLQIKFNPSYADGQDRKTACNAKLLKYLPDFKFTPFDQGLKETIQWFCVNIKYARITAPADT